MRAVPQHDRDPALPWLSAYYFVRAGVAAGWVAAALAFGRGMPAVAATLLVAYPAWDALANLVDARRNGGLADNPSQALNAAISSATALAVAVALGWGPNAVLAVFGAWAILSGLFQLLTGARRWRAGAQWAMVLSGAQSALAGGFFIKQAAGAAVPGIVDVAPYAAFGAFYFLVSAAWLRVAIMRGASRTRAARAARVRAGRASINDPDLPDTAPRGRRRTAIAPERASAHLHRRLVRPFPDQQRPCSMRERSSAKSRKSPFEAYLHVLHALMLRDMRTRFGASMWGYGVVVLWPCVHVFVLITIYTVQKLAAPLGDDRALFFATGAVPVLVFQYISREVMKSVITNRPLTYYPQVRLFDLVFSRVLVEIVTGFLALLVVSAVLVALGTDPVPADPLTAVGGYLAAITLGIGIGTINVAIIGFFPGWLIGYALFSIVLYVSSGVLFLPSYLPERLYYWAKFNPALQLAEWMRSAYYPAAGLQVDHLYVIMFGLTAASVGLCLVVRGGGRLQG